mmetsp:Transcript_86794/g.106466  ORF Transcript_86794/g.106466 Transcript_86794/m.106466 type:complete len:451 (+) Transcript_86794:150-1502(+)
MSGAFNIDIEIGADKNNNSGVKIYCASLTDNWNALRTFDELKQFYSDLSSDDGITNGNINIGKIPGNNDINGYEIFLSSLGCTAGVLRIKLFQDFLKIPMSVREGLSYAKHKPFGQTMKESYLMRHPRYVRRSAVKKFVRLTNDERGASLIAFNNNSTTNNPESALKISKQTEMKILKEIKFAFVLKSGKRQWVLQANNSDEFKSWFNELTNILNKLGGKIDSTNLNIQSGTNNSNNDNNMDILGVGTSNSDDIKQIQAENQKLKQALEDWKNKYTQLEAKTRDNNNDEIKMDIDLDDDVIDGDAADIKRKLIKEFTKEKDELIRDYEIQKDDLRAEIEDLRKKLESKIAVDNGTNGLKGLFGSKDEELKSQIDAEAGQLNNLTDEEKASIKFIHTHLHRHAHKHIHHHRHLHIHDNTQKPAVSYTNTHTVSHTITHTNTQFHIKKAKFF